MSRCGWVNESNELYCKYHDEEWGVPCFDDSTLFEFLILEGAQAGLSWETVLKKRENYRKAFNNFNPKKVAHYTEEKQRELLQDESLVRNKLKIASAVQNARVFCKLQEEFDSFSDYIWGFVDGKPIINKFKRLSEVPAQTELSQRISKDLKSRGMNFVGPTIIYAFMQAVGMVNDHLVDCYRYKETQLI